MWQYDDLSQSFEDYHQLFKQNGLNNMESLFAMCSSKLKEIGIVNVEHIEIIMDAIDQRLILEHEEFKQWLGNIVFDKNLLNEYCDVLKHYELPIYSFDSFFRNAFTETKLRRVLGARHTRLVSAIWNSYCS